MQAVGRSRSGARVAIRKPAAFVSQLDVSLQTALEQTSMNWEVSEPIARHPCMRLAAAAAATVSD